MNDTAMIVENAEDLSISWQSGPRDASQTHRHEMLHRPCLNRHARLRPHLDLSEQISDKKHSR
jgi:hypothetical protein